MNCRDCNHPSRYHKHYAGMCLYDGCMCNLFRKPPVGESHPKGDVHFATTLTGCCGEDISGQPVNALHDCPLDHIPREFIIAMGKVLRTGVKDGRLPMDWQQLPRLSAANKTANLFIHLDAKEYDAVACNALILWWHFQRQRAADTVIPGNDEGATK